VVLVVGWVLVLICEEIIRDCYCIGLDSLFEGAYTPPKVNICYWNGSSNVSFLPIIAVRFERSICKVEGLELLIVLEALVPYALLFFDTEFIKEFP
jgi:hypothetical protein